MIAKRKFSWVWMQHMGATIAHFRLSPHCYVHTQTSSACQDVEHQSDSSMSCKWNQLQKARQYIKKMQIWHPLLGKISALIGSYHSAVLHHSVTTVQIKQPQPQLRLQKCSRAPSCCNVSKKSSQKSCMYYT